MNKRYKNLLEKKKPNESRTPKKQREKWFLYILRCSDLSLYTGITKDLERRFRMHSAGKGARYTRTRLPLEIVYKEAYRTKRGAMIRECAVKALSKTNKLALIEKSTKKAFIFRLMN